MTVDSQEQVALHSIGIAHLGVASAVHDVCFGEPWSEGSIAELLTMPGGFGLLATFEDHPTGLVIAYSLGAEGEILTLCVVPAYRRRGIAAQLLAHALGRLMQQGCRRVTLEVAADNIAALGLYWKAGFSEVGRRLGYYRRDASVPMDAIVLASSLGADEAVCSAVSET